METLLVLSWTLLLGSITRLLTGCYLYLLPLQYIISAALVAWLECPLSSHRTNPLAAFGLIEGSVDGKSANQWQSLVRVALTPPSLLLAGSGFLPVLSRKRSIPEVLSRTRIVPLDPALDPRSTGAIQRAQNRIKIVVRAYTIFSLAIAVLILLVPVRVEHVLQQREPDVPSSGEGLLGNDSELLAIYLDLSMRNPDRIEFHVRLASLYYRNGMLDDLEHELEEIRILDPDHAILLLEDTSATLGSEFQNIVSGSDSLHLIVGPQVVPESQVDTISEQDTLPETLDSTITEPTTFDDTLTIAPDTIFPIIPDTLITFPPDSGEVIVTETDSISQPDTAFVEDLLTDPGLVSAADSLPPEPDSLPSPHVPDSLDQSPEEAPTE